MECTHNQSGPQQTAPPVLETTLSGIASETEGNELERDPAPISPRLGPRFFMSSMGHYRVHLTDIGGAQRIAPSFGDGLLDSAYTSSIQASPWEALTRASHGRSCTHGS